MSVVVAVGGAGAMGSRAVAALVAEGHDVVVADRRPTEVEGARYIEADASDQASIERAAAGAALIMNFAGPYYLLGDAVARAAIALELPYVDICDDAGATEALLLLDPQARAAGIPLIVGAGYSPGVLNGLAVRLAQGFDEIDELTTAWVVGEKGPSGAAPLLHFFYGITEDIPVWRDGAREMIPAFTPESSEEFPFADPVGPFPVRDVGHPETVTLPRVLNAKEIRNKGALMPRRATEVYDLLRKLGLLGSGSVTMSGVEVVARDFVAEFLTARHNERAGDSTGDVMALGVRVAGTAQGRPVTRYVAASARATMADVTGLPAAAAVPLLLAGHLPPGAHGPEVLPTDSWFPELARLAPHAYSDVEIWEDSGPRTTTSFEAVGRSDDLTQLFGAA